MNFIKNARKAGEKSRASEMIFPPNGALGVRAGKKLQKLPVAKILLLCYT